MCLQDYLFVRGFVRLAGALMVAAPDKHIDTLVSGISAGDSLTALHDQCTKLHEYIQHDATSWEKPLAKAWVLHLAPCSEITSPRASDLAIASTKRTSTHAKAEYPWRS